MPPLIGGGDHGAMTTTGSLPPATPPTLARTPVRRPAATPRWWADAAGFGAGLSLVVVTALWVANGGVQESVTGGWTAGS